MARIKPTNSRVATPLEAFEILRISRSAGYEAIRRKEIPSIRIGKRLLVPVAALDRLLAGDAK